MLWIIADPRCLRRWPMNSSLSILMIPLDRLLDSVLGLRALKWPEPGGTTRRRVGEAHGTIDEDQSEPVNSAVRGQLDKLLVSAFCLWLRTLC